MPPMYRRYPEPPTPYRRSPLRSALRGLAVPILVAAVAAGRAGRAEPRNATPPPPPDADAPPRAIALVRGSALVRIELDPFADRRAPLPRTIVRLPFGHVHGVAWGTNARVWAAWGGERPLPEELDVARQGSEVRQTLVLGGAGRRTAIRALDRYAGARRVVVARWNVRGDRLFLACAAGADLMGASSLLLVLGPDGREIARAYLAGAVAGAVSGGDGAWIATTNGVYGPVISRWTPPAEPAQLSWNVPLPRQDIGLAAIGEIARHPADANRFALACRTTQGDSAWIVVDMDGDRGTGHPLAENVAGVRGLTWSAEGGRVAFVAPVDRSFRWRNADVTVRMDALWVARPGSGASVFSDPSGAGPFRRPEDITMLGFIPAMDSFAGNDGGAFALTATAGGNGMPVRRIVRVRANGKAEIVAEDVAFRGPIAIVR